MKNNFIKIIIVNSIFILLFSACKNDTSIQNASVNNNTTQLPQDGTYTWSKHNDFDTFLNDFKVALKANDKEAIFQMISMPFLCLSHECDYFRLDNKTSKITTLDILSKKDFFDKYELIFNQELFDNISDGDVNNIYDVFINFPEKEGLFKKDDKYFYLYQESHVLSIINFSRDKDGYYKANGIPSAI